MSRYSATERLGVNATESLTLNELGWIFREQPISDMGIDAHMELVIDNNPTGKLLGVQIKTGASHFEEKKDSFIYRGKLAHLDYWLNHSLPVIIVAHLPKSKTTFWAHVSKASAERTAKGWKISIPKNQLLNKDSIPVLEALVSGTGDEVKRRNLFLHADNMRFLKQGGKLVIYKEEWPNKALGRGIMNLMRVDQGAEEVIKSDNYWYTGYSTKELIEKIYPWAELGVDEEFYEENFEDSVYDIYNKKYLKEDGIYPYEIESGEVSKFRLVMTLNNLGKAFIEVFDYLESGPDLIINRGRTKPFHK